MRLALVPALAFAVALLGLGACRSDPLPSPEVDGLVMGDMAGDLAVTSTTGVHCQDAICSPPATQCCSADNGKTGSCVSGTCPANLTYSCDDKSDCPGKICCDAITSGATCMDEAACKALPGSKRLCATATDCDAGENCCAQNAVKKGFSICSASACPF